MIGHMVLRKSVVEGSSHSSAAILGLKVVGGKLLSDGTRGAVVEKVKKGSIADIEGQLRIGKNKFVLFQVLGSISNNDF